MKISWLLGCSLGSVALGLSGVWFAMSLKRKTALFLARAVRLSGTVVELVPQGEENCLAPKYTFRDTAGRMRTVVSSSSSYPPRYSVGQAIVILFDAESGETRLGDWMDLRGAETIVGALAFLVCAIGVGLLIFSLS
jgi:hypothetical protein